MGIPIVRAPSPPSGRSTLIDLGAHVGQEHRRERPGGGVCEIEDAQPVSGNPVTGRSPPNRVGNSGSGAVLDGSATTARPGMIVVAALGHCSSIEHST